MVVAALFHDIGEVFSPGNHGSIASALLRPFVSPVIYWVLDKHEIFQGYYYFHHVGGDRHQRDVFKDHPYYQETVDFCHRWDQSSFDMGYPSMNESEFLPLVYEVFSTPAYMFDADNPKKMASFANL
uniref:HD domain-containing protein n=1 Tax=Octactis speculum TaxID=3111310 RepID=A0A7S2GIC3_9STRA|mmetsp:Transcript_47649/g.64880  ORF Transcript_47649/g.64880 Transcript_47649/m.64880 type:complete len:127 (+) Transcript_47649:101-481(+)